MGKVEGIGANSRIAPAGAPGSDGTRIKREAGFLRDFLAQNPEGGVVKDPKILKSLTGREDARVVVQVVDGKILVRASGEGFDNISVYSTDEAGGVSKTFMNGFGTYTKNVDGDGKVENLDYTGAHVYKKGDAPRDQVNYVKNREEGIENLVKRMQRAFVLEKLMETYRSFSGLRILGIL